MLNDKTLIKEKPRRKTKSTISISEREKQKLWFQNLLALKFPVQSLAEKHKITIHNSMFDKPNKIGFEIVCHFLFSKFDEEKAAELFKTCYPVYEKKQAHQFRTVCVNWWKRISEEQPTFNIPRASVTLLMSPSGPEFYRILFSFTTFVLYTESRRLNGKGNESTLLPPIRTKNKCIEQVQVVVMKNAIHSESRETMHVMQMSRQTDVMTQKLAGKLLQDYREKIKKKKFLEQKRKDLLGKLHFSADTRTTPSKFPSASLTPQKSIKARTDNSLAVVRKLWEKLLQAVKATDEQRSVVMSILSTNKGENEINANELAPKIPAALLQQCTHQVYESVGTSLYEAGQLNLVSLLKLFNLSLHLLIEKLHEVGVPNFENQIPYISAQSHICEKNTQILKNLCKTLQESSPETEKTIQTLTLRLDEIYSRREESGHSSILSGLSKPNFQSTKVGYEKNSRLGVLPLTPPFRFSDPVDYGTPAFLHEGPKMTGESIHAIPMMRDILIRAPKSPAVNAKPTLYDPSSMTPKSPVVNHVAQLQDHIAQLQDHINLKEEPVVSLKQGKLEIGPSPKTTRRGKTMETILQHRAMRKKLAEKSTDFSMPVPRHVEGNSKASSLPSTPVAKPNDTVMEKVKSRTPEAVRKLINQVVDYTMLEMSILPGYKPSEVTPVNPQENPAFFDISSQLDATVFETRNEIERTPPASFTLDPASEPIFAAEPLMKENVEPNNSTSQFLDYSISSHSSCDSNNVSSRLAKPATNIPFKPESACAPKYLTPDSPWSTSLDDIDFSKYTSIMDVPCPDLLTPNDFLDSFHVSEPENAYVPVGNLIDL